MTRRARGRARRPFALGVVVSLVALSGCQAEPPFFESVRYSGVQVSAGWTPVVGDFDGDWRDDIFWYDGERAEQLWTSRDTLEGAEFDKAQAPGQLGPGYLPIAGDFGGDRADDILWTTPSLEQPLRLWIMAAGGTIAEERELDLPRERTTQVIVDHTSRDGVAFVADDGSTWVWGPDDGDGLETYIGGPGRRYGGVVVPGDFDGDGNGDVFLPGRPTSSIAWGDGAEGFTFTTTRGIGGSYQIVAMHLDHDAPEDLVFAADSIGHPPPTPVWFGRGDRTFGLTTQAPIPLRGPVEVHGDHTFVKADTLVRYGTGAGLSVWSMDRDRVIHTPPAGARLTGPGQVLTRLVGNFRSGGADDVLVYDQSGDGYGEALIMTHDGQD